MSSGALDMAKCNFEQMLKLCAVEVDSSDSDLVAVQKKSFHDVAHELVRQVTSPNTLVREQVGCDKNGGLFVECNLLFLDT